MVIPQLEKRVKLNGHQAKKFWAVGRQDPKTHLLRSTGGGISKPLDLGTWFSEHGGGGWMIGLGDCSGLSQL